MNSNELKRARAYFNWITVLHAEVTNIGRLFRKQLNINSTQASILLELSNCEKPIKMGDLSNSLVLSPNTLTAAVTMLEENDLIHRYRSDRDQRVVLIEITDAGKKLLPKFETVFRTHLESVAKVLSKDEWFEAYNMIVSYADPKPYTFFKEPLATDIGGFIIVRNILLLLTLRARIEKITLNEVRILFYIACNDSNFNLRDISHTLYIRQNALTVLVGRLEKANLIVKKHNEADKRTSIITLSKEGEAITDRVFNSIDRFIKENKLNFSQEPPEALLKFDYMLSM